MLHTFFYNFRFTSGLNQTELVGTLCSFHFLFFKIVEIAMVADVNKGMSILNRRHERWGDHNLMELSYVGQLRAFIASKSIIFVKRNFCNTGIFTVYCSSLILCPY